MDSTCGLGETGRQGKMELTKGQDFEDAGFDFNNTLITVCIVWDTLIRFLLVSTFTSCVENNARLTHLSSVQGLDVNRRNFSQTLVTLTV